MNSYERLCFNLLGKRMKAKREDYSQLRNDLISARLKTPFEVYISTALVSSVIVGFGAAFVIGILSWLLKLPALIKYKGAVPGFLVALTPYSLIIGTILITVFSLIIFGGLTYVVFIMYPSVEAGNRAGVPWAQRIRLCSVWQGREMFAPTRQTCASRLGRIASLFQEMHAFVAMHSDAGL
jgi:flagellar protein FlaJ